MDRSEHSMMEISIDTWSAVGDVCIACSDPDAGIWVPVSFCPEAKADADKYYEEMDKSYLRPLIERGKNH
jgi:hypothetical protein